MHENVTIEVFANQNLQCGEGPVWNEAMQCLHWTDSGGTTTYTAHMRHREPRVLFNGHHAASLALHEDGGIVYCGAQGFHHLDASGVHRNFSQTCDGISVSNINDIIADETGRVIGGQDAFRENEKYKPGYLFQLGTDKKIKVIEEGLHLSNGMGFSPTSDRFYLVDSILRKIYLYDYDPETGDISNKRTLVTLDRNDGLPDGMTVDEEGFIWVARWFGNSVARYDPDGKLERTIQLPVAQPSSVIFGGPDYHHLFITSAAVEWVTPLAPDNHVFSTPRGGSVYRAVLDIRGRPEYRARI